MQIELLGWRQWGGARPGAGRKRTSRRLPHVSRVAPHNSVFHVTARVMRGLGSLRSGRIVQRIEESFRRGCARADFRIVHYSIQRDHVHLIVEAESPAALGRGVRSQRIRVARAANAVRRRRGAVFADRFHHHLLSTPREVRNAIAYVLRNGRKHFGERVQPGWIDPASSGRWFWGRAHDAPAVALPRYWLLRAGWRRHGEISA